mmetsp:Transcript_67812/g.185988  ORF Transcript_67812/g.185988 Transcript_67812/m.185988 type:complete len:227 (-) Transcript_67812:217-897(-)
MRLLPALRVDAARMPRRLLLAAGSCARACVARARLDGAPDATPARRRRRISAMAASASVGWKTTRSSPRKSSSTLRRPHLLPHDRGRSRRPPMRAAASSTRGPCSSSWARRSGSPLRLRRQLERRTVPRRAMRGRPPWTNLEATALVQHKGWTGYRPCALYGHHDQLPQCLTHNAIYVYRLSALWLVQRRTVGRMQLPASVCVIGTGIATRCRWYRSRDGRLESGM